MLKANYIELVKGKFFQLGPAAFSKAIKTAVDQTIGAKGVRKTLRFLKNGYQNLYDYTLPAIASDPALATEETFIKIACMLSDLQVPIDWTTSFHPWSNLQSDSRVVVLVADKRNDDDPRSRRSLDLCDVRSVDSVQTIRDRLNLSFNVQRQIVSGTLDRDSVEVQLDKLCEKPDVKMILSTSSDLRNPYSAAIADRITRGQPLPVRFRWSTRPPRMSSLSFAEPGTIEQLGIATEEGVLVRRHIDAEIIEKSKQTEFFDSGLLLIDFLSDPALIVAAGHGGNGTHGCVEALWRKRHEISDYLAGSTRGLAAIKVTLRKETDDFADDLYIWKVDIIGWYPLA